MHQEGQVSFNATSRNSYDIKRKNSSIYDKHVVPSFNNEKEGCYKPLKYS